MHHEGATAKGGEAVAGKDGNDLQPLVAVVLQRDSDAEQQQQQQQQGVIKKAIRDAAEPYPKVSAGVGPCALAQQLST